MKLLYKNENRFLVKNIENILRSHEIPLFIKNEHASAALGEIPVFDSWLEIWVLDENDYEKAKSLIKNIEKTSNEKDWKCSKCSEDNGAAFEYCWNCQTNKNT